MAPFTFKNQTFSCHMTCDQCAHPRSKSTGTRCKNRVCFGIPLCWIHAQQTYGVRIKPSTSPGAQKGLFSVKGVRKGDWICPYVGELIGTACMDLRYPEGEDIPYLAIFNDETSSDAACHRGSASMAKSLFKENGDTRSRRSHNATLQMHLGQAWLKAYKIIPPGGEILVYVRDSTEGTLNYTTKRAGGVDTRPC